jgi:hypothetical protein
VRSPKGEIISRANRPSSCSAGAGGLTRVLAERASNPRVATVDAGTMIKQSSVRHAEAAGAENSGTIGSVPSLHQH